MPDEVARRPEAAQVVLELAPVQPFCRRLWALNTCLRQPLYWLRGRIHLALVSETYKWMTKESLLRHEEDKVPPSVLAGLLNHGLCRLKGRWAGELGGETTGLCRVSSW